MKIRNGWVGNSSSSSFVILMGQPETKEDFETWFGDCGHRSSREEEKVKKDLETINNIKSLHEKGLISTEIAKNIVNNMKNLPDFIVYNDVEKNTFNPTISQYYNEYTKDKVIDLLWEAYNKKEDAEFDDNWLRNNKKRIFLKVKNWKEQLGDKNSYLYNIITRNIICGLSEKLDYEKNGVDENKDDDDWDASTDYIHTFDFIYDKKISNNLIEYLTNQKIDFIKNVICEEDDDLDCYIITFCSDDGESTEFDYVGMKGQIFRDTIFHISDHNH